MIWIEIDSTPSVALYREPAARALIATDLAVPALSSVGTLRRPLSIPGLDPAENANISLNLDNANGKLTALWAADPPIRTAARVMSDSGELFAGVITDINLGAQASLDIESGLVRPLTDTVPLRRATVWGDYSAAATLAIVYGRATVAAAHYQANTWHVADHPVQGIDSVLVAGELRADWTGRNTVDSTGQAVALITFATPVDADAEVSVSLRGRMHPATGALMERPDEILWDFLVNVCGLPLAVADFDAFRVECTGLVLAGALTDRTKSIRAQVDEILQSIGGAWSASAADVAMLFPLVDYADRPTEITVDPLHARDLQAACSHASLANVLRIDYAYDWATGQPAQSIEIEDAESIRLYGRIETTWPAYWCTSARQARALGARLLDWLSTPKWTVTWVADRVDLRPGDWADFDHPALPIAGRHRILSTDTDYAARQTTLIALGVGVAPTIVYPPAPPGATRITESGDTRITESGDVRVLES